MNDPEKTAELIHWLDGYVVSKGIRLPFDYADQVAKRLETIFEDGDSHDTTI